MIFRPSRPRNLNPSTTPVVHPDADVARSFIGSGFLAVGVVVLLVAGALGHENHKPVTAARHHEHHSSPDSESAGGPNYASGRPAVAALSWGDPID